MFRIINNKNIIKNIRYLSYEKNMINLLEKYEKNNLNLIEKLIKYSTSIFLFPLGIAITEKNNIQLIFRFGKYDGFLKPGLSWTHPFSTQLRVFYCGDITINFSNINITDVEKNPINISSYISYQYIDPIKNYLNVGDNNVLHNYLESKLREYISNFSYNELTSKNNIYDFIINELNETKQLEEYGIKIVKIGISQINYAPEIAQVMLVKQKTKATLEARKEIVDTTLNIINDISSKLDNKLSSEDKSKLVTCLTISMIGQSTTSNVINIK